jgi:hypothetical protein
VPQLEIGLDRLMVSLEIEKALDVLARDHIRRAQDLAVKDLAIKALELLLKSVRAGQLSKYTSKDKFWMELRWYAWHLVENGRPSMTDVLKPTIFKVLQAVYEKLEAGADEMKSVDVSNIRGAVEDVMLDMISVIQSRPGVVADRHQTQQLEKWLFADL